mmetsp:Transcript_9432/g.18267  ORF Transcript_9432/g.18267 Transcript_9432/m.18267 type:complete len:122 (+) Transcript_9432:584-949(+)
MARAVTTETPLPPPPVIGGDAQQDDVDELTEAVAEMYIGKPPRILYPNRTPQQHRNRKNNLIAKVKNLKAITKWDYDDFNAYLTDDAPGLCYKAKLLKAVNGVREAEGKSVVKSWHDAYEM